MIEYPEIPGSFGQSFREFDAHVWDKLDGANLRFEWSRKAGWYKYGTRRRRFDETDPMFGPAISIFANQMAEELERVAHKQRWQRLIVFCEFWGPETLGGLYEPGEADRVTLFDVAADREPLMEPKRFLKLFKQVPTPHYLGKLKWNRQFVKDVWEGKIDGITREGVVGKMDTKRTSRVTAKAKTEEWVTALRERRPDEAEGLINS